jgi:type I restriction enzyme, S subunit
MSVAANKATGWDRVPFLEVCDIQGGTQPPKDEWISEAREGYVRMLQIRDFTQPDRAKVEYVKDSSKLKKCEDEDILIGRYGASVGKILHGLSGAYNVAIAKCILNHQRIERHYLLSWLRSSYFQNAVQNFGGRAAQAGFNKTDLGKLKIPLPPLAEQRRIAAILESADALRAKRRESLAQLNTLLQSTFLNMFGDPVTNPMGWEETCIGDITDMGSGSTPSRRHEDYFDGSIPWVKSTEVNLGTISDTSECVSTSGVEAARLKLYPMGSIVLALYGQGKTRGKCAKLGIDATINQACCSMVPKEPRSTEFLLGFLKQSYFRLRGESRGGNQENLNMGIVRRFPIPFPPLDLQHRFASIVESVEQQKTSQRAHMDELDTLFASLQSRAFRGDL